MAVEEWYERLREESRKFMEENQRHWDERQREWDRRRIADERRQTESQIGDHEWDRRRIADQDWKWRMQDSERRFNRSLNEIRVQLGMPLDDYSCDATAEENRWEGTKVAAATPEEIEASKQQIRDDETRGSGSGLFGGSEARSSFNQTPPIDFPANLEEGLGTDNVNHQSTHLANLSAANSQASSKGSDVSLGIEGVRDPTIFWGINIDSECRTLFKYFRIELDLGAPNQKLLVESNQHPEVISHPLDSNPLDVRVAVESDRMDELALPEFAMVKRADRRMISVEWLEVLSAPKLFVKMSDLVGRTVFDPGGSFVVIDYQKE